MSVNDQSLGVSGILPSSEGDLDQPDYEYESSDTDDHVSDEVNVGENSQAPSIFPQRQADVVDHTIIPSNYESFTLFNADVVSMLLAPKVHPS